MRHHLETLSVLLTVILLAIFTPLPVTAQSEPPANPRLVKDINTAQTDSSDPNGFMPAGLLTYFFANQGEENSELWKTDGTAAGTELVKAGLIAGENSSALYQGHLYFPARTLETGVELWRTNGTPTDTELFADLRPGSSGSDPMHLTVFEEKLYFDADFARFYSSDGTSEGTIRDESKCIQSPMMEFKNSLYYSGCSIDSGGIDHYYLAWFGSGGSGETTDLMPGKPEVIYDGQLYFTAARADVGWELWTTDGTLGSIRLLKDINLTGDANVSNLVIYNNLLYFIAEDAEFGQRLWRTDGTSDGTLPFFDPPDNMQYWTIPGAIQPADPGQPGGVLLEFSTIAEKKELWVSDGTLQGTQFLANAGDSSTPSGILFDNTYYFPAYDTEHGVELWRSDGTPAGTSLLADVWPGQHGSLPEYFASCGTHLCFSADDGVHGKELWSTDGTSQGTVLIADLNPRPSNAYPTNFAQADSWVYFFANDSVAEPNLWRTDSTTEGTLALNLDPAVTFLTDPAVYDPRTALLGNTLFFPAKDPLHGSELWKTDGTLQGTNLIRDIWPGEMSSNPRQLMAAENRLFFFASSPEAKEELWVSDGSPEGTVQVKELVPNGSGNLLTNMAVLGSAVIFSFSRADTSACELWRSDGSSAGTWRISEDLCFYAGEKDRAVYNGKLYFPGNSKNIVDPSLWETDGTAAGTRQVPIDIGAYSPSVFKFLTPTTDGLYMIVQVYDGAYLYRIPSDGGSGAIAYRFYNINGVGTSVKELIAFNRQVAIIVNRYSPESERRVDELWISDGTEAGTRRIEAGFDRPANEMILNDALYFTANDSVNGIQLWRTDGTGSGTERVSNYPQTRCMPAVYEHSITAFTPGALLLALSDEFNDPTGTGCELWFHVYDPLPYHKFLSLIFK